MQAILSFLFFTVKESHIFFFITSTFGNGDPPTDAKPFNMELQKHLRFSGSSVFTGMK